MFSLINYDKLADAILKKCENKIIKATKDKVAECLISKLEDLDINDVYIEEPCYRYGIHGEARRTPLAIYAARKNADILISDIYKLKQLELMKEVTNERITDQININIKAEVRRAVASAVDSILKK